MKLKIYNFVFETYEDEKDYYIDCDMNVINKDDRSVNPQCEAQLDQGWISIESKMPNNNQRVLVLSDGEINVAVSRDYGGECFEDAYGNNTEFVTHWMPLPSLPKL